MAVTHPRARTHVRLFSVLLLLLPVVGLLAPARLVAAETSPGIDVIVLFKDGTDAVQRDQILTRAGAGQRHHFRLVDASAARLPSALVQAVLARHPDVAAVVPDRPVQAHAKPGQGGTPASQVVPAGVHRVGADLVWPTGTTGAGIGVAVVDTGLDFAHQDLPVAPAPSCFTAFAFCQDDNGHGTHVGGIIAARNNTVDVVGVAPDATLYAVKVLDQSGSGTDTTVMAGLEWIAEHASAVSPPIRVVNMSLGRPGTLDDNPALHALVQKLHDAPSAACPDCAGLVVVVSAGNDANREVSQEVPATYPEVLAIASSTALGGTNSCRFFSGTIQADTASYFTTDGAFTVDPLTGLGVGVTVSAPGEERENISRSCFVQSVGILSTRLGGGSTRMSGTSMAAPHVAGVAALLLQKFSADLTPEGVRDRIRLTADGQASDPLDSPTTGYTFDGEREGILWAPGALQ